MQSRRQSANEDPNFLTTSGTELPTISTSGIPGNNPQRNSRRESVGPSTARTSANSLAQQNTLNTQPTNDNRQPQRPAPAIWRPSIRIRRFPSSGNLPGGNPQINQPYDNTSRRDWQLNNNSTPHINNHVPPADDTIDTSNRRRSSSEPQRPAWLSSQSATTAGPPRVRAGSYIPDIIEEASPTQTGPTFAPIHPGGNTAAHEVPIPLQHSHTYSEAVPNAQGEYDTDLVDFLDLVGMYPSNVVYEYL